MFGFFWFAQFGKSDIFPICFFLHIRFSVFVWKSLIFSNLILTYFGGLFAFILLEIALFWGLLIYRFHQIWKDLLIISFYIFFSHSFLFFWDFTIHLLELSIFSHISVHLHHLCFLFGSFLVSFVMPKFTGLLFSSLSEVNNDSVTFSFHVLILFISRNTN